MSFQRPQDARYRVMITMNPALESRSRHAPDLRRRPRSALAHCRMLWGHWASASGTRPWLLWTASASAAGRSEPARRTPARSRSSTASCRNAARCAQILPTARTFSSAKSTRRSSNTTRDRRSKRANGLSASGARLTIATWAALDADTGACARPLHRSAMPTSLALRCRCRGMPEGPTEEAWLRFLTR